MVVSVRMLGSARHQEPCENDEQLVDEDLLLDAMSRSSVKLALVEVVGLLQPVEFLGFPTPAVQLGDLRAGELRSPQRREIERGFTIGLGQLDGAQLDSARGPAAWPAVRFPTR